MSVVRDLQASLDWTTTGTALFLDTLDRLPDTALAEATSLPGWTGRHLVAHIVGNADALVNLAHWATTGVETPMYGSPDQRDADITAGARLEPADLRRRVRQSAQLLTDALHAVPSANWQHDVRTAQGRVVPASEIPWLRAREVMIHAVDLNSGLTFDDLPAGFLAALVDDVVVRRSNPANPALVLVDDTGACSWTVHGSGPPTAIHESLSTIAALLTGRPLPAGTSLAARELRLPAWL